MAVGRGKKGLTCGMGLLAVLTLGVWGCGLSKETKSEEPQTAFVEVRQEQAETDKAPETDKATETDETAETDETSTETDAGNEETDTETTTESDENREDSMENNAVTTTTSGQEVWQELEVKEPTITVEEATEVSLVYSKTEHTLSLLNAGEVIGVYSAGSGRGHGDKEQEGDLKTPEGEFYVCVKNENSSYHLAFGLSYPNVEDARRGLDSGLISQEEYDDIEAAITEGRQPDWYTALGGEIMIHGQKGDQGGESDWTSGCIAVDNEVMDVIWDYVEEGTSVTIEP